MRRMPSPISNARIVSLMPPRLRPAFLIAPHLRSFDTLRSRVSFAMANEYDRERCPVEQEGYEPEHAMGSRRNGRSRRDNAQWLRRALRHLSVIRVLSAAGDRTIF